MRRGQPRHHRGASVADSAPRPAGVLLGAEPLPARRQRLAVRERRGDGGGGRDGAQLMSRVFAVVGHTFTFLQPREKVG